MAGSGSMRRSAAAGVAPDAVQAIEKDVRGVAALVAGPRQQLARLVDLAGVVGRHAGMEQFFGLAMALGQRTARPLDVGAGTVVVTFEKHHARPDADRVFVVSGEIVIEPEEQELFDSRLTVGVVWRIRASDRVGRQRIRHPGWEKVEAIIGQNSSQVNELQGQCGAGSRRPSGRSCTSTGMMIECVPNVSEGRRTEVVDRLVRGDSSVCRARGCSIVRRIRRTTDRSSRWPANRRRSRQAILALFEIAVAEIDLRTHSGEHPRFGAVDVVPFIPIEGATMDDCVTLAKETGAEVARRFQVPVYLYEEASTNPARKNLEDIRRGQFEGLAAKMSQPEWAPDYGPPAPHPSAGATVIGARMPLIAYNINLATDRLDVAKKIAATVRFSSGGFRYVKAMGVALEDRGIVQVSMNLTNYEKTPIFRVFDAVKREAERYGVAVLESEIVGLVPAAALVDTARHVLQLEQFTAAQILETRLRDTR